MYFLAVSWACTVFYQTAVWPFIHMHASSFVDENSYHFLFKESDDPISGILQRYVKSLFTAATSAIHCNTVFTSSKPTSAAIVYISNRYFCTG